MAPEILNKEYYIGQKADIWAVGVVLFKIVSGSFPFQG